MRAIPASPDAPGITADPAAASRGFAAMGRSYWPAHRSGRPLLIHHCPVSGS